MIGNPFALGLGLFNQAGISADLLIDLAARARDVKFSTGEHGFQSFTCFVPMDLEESFYYYNRPGLFRIAVTGQGSTVWEGRLEDVAIVPGGVRLTALGYWRALGDVPYTTLWSTTSIENWRAVTAAEIGACLNERWQWDNNNRLFIAPRENEYYSTNARAGLTFAAPEDGDRNIYIVSFDYAWVVPSATWQVDLRSLSDTFTGATIEWSLTGGSASGSATVTLSAPNDRLVFLVWYDNASETQWTGAHTGSAYLKITNLRIKSTLNASLYASEIATALVTYVNAINSTQLSASAALINSPAVDLTDEVYEDALPSDILDRLARLGDNSTPVALYETGVWEDRLLTFQKRGATARQWYVDISELELERTIDALANSAYATYQEAAGRTLRAAISTNADSVARYGLTRRRAVDASTTSSTQAGVQRDAALADGKDARPRIRIQFDAVYDASGTRWPLWVVRAWDTCVIRNLQPTLSTAIDRIRTFRILETEYDADRGQLTLTPEQYLPTLETLVLRREAGIGV